MEDKNDLVNTPIARELRTRIKAEAAKQGKPMYQLLDEIVQDYYRKQESGTTRRDPEGSGDAEN